MIGGNPRLGANGSDFPTFRSEDGDRRSPRTSLLGSDTCGNAFRLTTEEMEIVAALEDKERIVKERIRALALPSYAGIRGLILHGAGGHGKSRLVQTVLDDVRGPGKWLRYNSDMSPPALIAEMKANCTTPLVFEDCEHLLGNYKILGTLRSAMAPPHRIVAKNMKAAYDFIFQAPIYILANLAINERNGVLAAIASRTGPIWWQLTRPEMIVRMKEIALSGNDDLTVAERWEVAQFCIERLNTGGRVDLRTLCDVGFPARILYKKGDLKIDWREYIDSYVFGSAEPRSEGRAERIARERQIACEVYLEAPNTGIRHRLWEERTGLRKTAFRDRLREAKANGLFDQWRRQWRNDSKEPTSEC